MDFLSPEGMADVDRRTAERGVSVGALMEAAGGAVAQEVWRAFPHPGWSALVLCGRGNNGGDGFVAARELRGRYRSVHVFLAGELERVKREPRAAAEAYLAIGGSVTSVGDAGPLRSALAGGDGDEGDAVVLVDALLGTGTRGEIGGLYRELLEAACDFTGPVVAVDGPSGLDMATGRPLGPVPAAALTVTFGAPKLGHVLGQGPELTGRVVVRDIGLDAAALAEAADRDDAARALEPGEAERLLPLPPRRAHKRSAGVVAVVAGSRAYLGAAVLTCLGALRAGAGLVHALVPMDLKAVLASEHPELIVSGLPAGADGSLCGGDLEPLKEALRFARPSAIVAGPGLGSGEGNRALVRELAGVAGGSTPLLLDADALNAFAGRLGELREVARRASIAITPHPGELGRLLGLDPREVDERRLELAGHVTVELGCPVLLKGVPTVVRAAGRKPVLNLTGNQGLARGGTGDVLSGIAGAFLAKRMDPFDALALAAFVHGLAADVAREELGILAMTATDVVTHLSTVLRGIERRETRDLLRLSRGYPVRGEAVAQPEPVR